MDPKTLELIRILQAGPYDNSAFQRIQQLLPDVRDRLRASGDRESLAEVTELLQQWAGSAVDPAAASLALYEGGELAEQMLGDPTRAAEMFSQSVAADPRNLEAMQCAERSFTHLGQFRQLEAMLSGQAFALAARPEAEPEIRAAVFRSLGSVQAERTGNVDGAIDAFEQALDAEADVAVVATLAQLYAGRNRDDDAWRAADLYCTLGEVSEDEQSVAYLEQALNLAPDHEQALDGLEELVPEAERPARLGGRWTAFVTAAPDGPGTDARRRALAQAFMEEERYAEALQWISPLAAKGDTAAESIREGLHRLMGGDPASVQPPESVRSDQDKWRSVSAPPQPFDEQTRRGFHAAAPQARPPFPPAHAPPPATESYHPPAHLPRAAARSQNDVDTQSIPPVQSGATLAGFALPPKLKELAGEAIETKSPTAEPAQVSPPPVPVAPDSAPAAKAPAPAAAVAAATAPATVPVVADAAFLPEDMGVKPKSALPKLLIGAGSLALVAGGVFVYTQHFMNPAERAASTRTTPSGEAQPGTSGGEPGGEQPGAAAEPTPAAEGEAASEGAKEAEAAKPEETEKAASDQKAAQAATATDTKTDTKTKTETKTKTKTGGKEGPRAVRMVSNLLRVRGGKVDQGALMKAAEKAFPAMERCYKKARRRRPRLKGRVVLSWTVKTNGRAAGARRVSGTIKNRTFAGCLAGAIKKTRFPRPKRKAARVWLPFVFQHP